MSMGSWSQRVEVAPRPQRRGWRLITGNVPNTSRTYIALLDGGIESATSARDRISPEIAFQDVVPELGAGWTLSQSESDWEVELEEEKFVECIYGHEISVSDTIEEYRTLLASEHPMSNAWSASVTEKEADWERLGDRMYESVGRIFDVGAVSPVMMADFLFRVYERHTTWLETLSEQLNRRLPGISLSRTLQVWNLSEDEAAKIFNVSSQTVKQWLEQGIPSEMEQMLSDVAAATDLLTHYLKRDRIPAVVRNPIDSLDGCSLMTLLTDHDTKGLLETCRNMFEFERANG